MRIVYTHPNCLDLFVGRYAIMLTCWRSHWQWFRVWYGRYPNLGKNVFEFGPLRIIQSKP